MYRLLRGSFYLGRPGPQLYHRYAIPSESVATGKSNYRMTYFNASLSTQLVSCLKVFLLLLFLSLVPKVHLTPRPQLLFAAMQIVQVD